MGSDSKVIAALGVVLAVFGCTKESAAGPQGPQGPQVNAGAPAMQGPGAAGTIAMVPPPVANNAAGATAMMPVTNTAGATAMEPLPQGGAPAAGGAGGTGMEPTPVGPNTIPSARNGCPNLHTDFPGDDACLAPPDPAKGFQIHIGPSSYTDMAEVNKFTMEPGAESSECYLKKLMIDQDRLYMVYELSGRPGTHHIINTLLNTGVRRGLERLRGLRRRRQQQRRQHRRRLEGAHAADPDRAREREARHPAQGRTSRCSTTCTTSTSRRRRSCASSG